jgi:hypothetical protein
MNLHTPERAPNESRADYAKRRKASHEHLLRATKPQRYMPRGFIRSSRTTGAYATPHDNWGNR